LITIDYRDHNSIASSGVPATLINVDNTIIGGGQIGDGYLTLVNQAGGVIEAAAVGNYQNLRNYPGTCRWFISRPIMCSTGREWDTAAGHAVLLAAGATVTDIDGRPMHYGKPDYRNGDFIAWGTAPGSLQ
jgi:hypothetical protein